METIITRVGFCDNCCKNRNPRTGIFFVVMGTTGWHILKSKAMGKIGFVPMNYKLIKTIGENVVYEKLCSIHDCGMEVFYDSNRQSYQFIQGKWGRGVMSVKTWNALQQYKHDGDYSI